MNHRCVPFTRFLAQLLPTLTCPFFVQVRTPDKSIFPLAMSYQKVMPPTVNKQIGHLEHKTPQNVNLVVRFNERVHFVSHDDNNG